MKTLVALYAQDWSIRHEQVDYRIGEFNVLWGWICGFLVKEDDEKIVITQQWFNNDDIRHTMIVPKVCVKERIDKELKPADEAGK
jgi:hypothetical protein